MQRIEISEGLFKDHISSFSLSPAEGEKFNIFISEEKTRMFSGKDKQQIYIGATQWRSTGFIIIGIIALIGGIAGFILWKRKKKKPIS